MHGMKLELYNEDYLAALSRIEDKSIRAVITDPPYATTDLPWDKQINWPDYWAEVDRVCMENAVVVMFSAQPFTTDLINSNRKGFRYELIWTKRRATGFLDANRRPLRAHENILVFARRFNQTTYNPQKTPGVPYVSKRGHTSSAAHYTTKTRVATVNTTGDRHPKSYQEFAHDNMTGKSWHPTQKPVALMRWLVLTYSRQRDVVLDPFMGSGSTGVACLETSRGFVGIERDPEYFAIAQKRMQEVRDLHAKMGPK